MNVTKKAQQMADNIQKFALENSQLVEYFEVQLQIAYNKGEMQGAKALKKMTDKFIEDM